MDSTRALICTLSLHDALPISRRHSPTHSKGDESMKRTCALLLFLAIAAPLAAQPQSPPMGPSPKATIRDGKTLYQRLGGYDAIAKTVDAFLPHLLAADPKIPNMISGLSEASRMRNRQMI